MDYGKIYGVEEKGKLEENEGDKKKAGKKEK